MVVGFDRRALCLLGKYSTLWRLGTIKNLIATNLARLSWRLMYLLYPGKQDPGFLI
jgi:hypothetical protein